MRASIAYFAGAGTVVIAIAAGLGGGLTIANIMSPHPAHQDTTRLEQRTSPQPASAANQTRQPVPYLAATQAAGDTMVPSPSGQAPSQPSTEAGGSPPQSATPSKTTAANDTAAKPDDARPAKPAAPAVQSNSDQPQLAASQDAMAKARDADMKRWAEKRKAERRQQWADRRRYREPRGQDLRDVEQSVREDTEPRYFVDEPQRLETPQIRLFGPD
jgi:hypothetical protein